MGDGAELLDDLLQDLIGDHQSVTAGEQHVADLGMIGHVLDALVDLPVELIILRPLSYSGALMLVAVIVKTLCRVFRAENREGLEVFEEAVGIVVEDDTGVQNPLRVN